MSTMTFTVLESLNRNRIEARIHKGHNAEQELGSVVWLNLSMLKIIAEAQLDGSGNRQAEGGADQLATAPESKPESDAKPKSKSEKPAR